MSSVELLPLPGLQLTLWRCSDAVIASEAWQSVSSKFPLDKWKNCGIISNVPAGIAHPVERHLAKVEVASSSLVARSKIDLRATAARKSHMAP